MCCGPSSLSNNPREMVHQLAEIGPSQSIFTDGQKKQLDTAQRGCCGDYANAIFTISHAFFRFGSAVLLGGFALAVHQGNLDPWASTTRVCAEIGAHVFSSNDSLMSGASESVKAALNCAESPRLSQASLAIYRSFEALDPYKYTIILPVLAAAVIYSSVQAGTESRRVRESLNKELNHNVVKAMNVIADDHVEGVTKNNYDKIIDARENISKIFNNLHNIKTELANSQVINSQPIEDMITTTETTVMQELPADRDHRPGLPIRRLAREISG